MTKFKPNLLFWAFVLLAAFSGAAFAQDGSTPAPGIDFVNTIFAGALLPFVAAFLNRRNLSSDAKGWIAIGLSVLFAAGLQWYQGGWRFDTLDGNAILGSFGAVFTISQGIHRTLRGLLNKIEVATDRTAEAQSTPPATVPQQPSNSQTSKEIVKDKGEELAIELIRKEAAERGYGTIAGLVLGGGLSLVSPSSLQNPPIVESAPLPEFDDGSFETDILPGFLTSEIAEAR